MSPHDQSRLGRTVGRFSLALRLVCWTALLSHGSSPGDHLSLTAEPYHSRTPLSPIKLLILLYYFTHLAPPAGIHGAAEQEPIE